MVRDIVTWPDPVLRRPAQPVGASGVKYDKELVEDMIETCRRAQGIGLAAPQVGVAHRLFVACLPDKKPLVFYNPEVGRRGQIVSAEEGCLSLPGMKVTVPRYDTVIVIADDADGKKFALEAEGLLARVIQHENDHLDGVLIFDHLDDFRQHLVLAAYHSGRADAKLAQAVTRS